MKHRIAMNPQTYDLLRSLLSRGIVELDGKTLDFTSVQRISISNGMMNFDPPARLTADLGPINVRTTISSLTVLSGGIRVEIDNSPIDLELRPQ